MNILITGATSGIGKELAKIYANEFNSLFLTGRDEKRLQEVKKICQNLGADVETEIIDIADELATKKWIKNISKNHNIDLVIANAGISAGTEGGPESFDQVKKIFDTNIQGVLNTIQPLIEIMKKQKSGQIAIMSSLAGFRGLPSSPAYSASKSCVRVYGEGLRGNLHNFGIKVNVICPGYVKTPMTDANKFPMPFLMPVEKAAKIIKTGLDKNKSRIAFPFTFYFVVWLATLLSNTIIDPIFRKLPGKSSL
ncbi:MAG: SDR family NAD(P)-dependent oxidoreductase [Rickettsiales bacterium]|nr:SDR family NAD(P)-dependent oxidoreductase [Rickettsiales bacterium]